MFKGALILTFFMLVSGFAFGQACIESDCENHVDDLVFIRSEVSAEGQEQLINTVYDAWMELALQPGGPLQDLACENSNQGLSTASLLSTEAGMSMLQSLDPDTAKDFLRQRREQGVSICFNPLGDSGSPQERRRARATGESLNRGAIYSATSGCVGKFDSIGRNLEVPDNAEVEEPFSLPSGDFASTRINTGRNATEDQIESARLRGREMYLQTAWDVIYGNSDVGASARSECERPDPSRPGATVSNRRCIIRNVCEHLCRTENFEQFRDQVASAVRRTIRQSPGYGDGQRIIEYPATTGNGLMPSTEYYNMNDPSGGELNDDYNNICQNFSLSSIAALRTLEPDYMPTLRELNQDRESFRPFSLGNIEGGINEGLAFIWNIRGSNTRVPFQVETYGNPQVTGEGVNISYSYTDAAMTDSELSDEFQSDLVADALPPGAAANSSTEEDRRTPTICLKGKFTLADLNILLAEETNRFVDSQGNIYDENRNPINANGTPDRSNRGGRPAPASVQLTRINSFADAVDNPGTTVNEEMQTTRPRFEDLEISFQIPNNPESQLCIPLSTENGRPFINNEMLSSTLRSYMRNCVYMTGNTPTEHPDMSSSTLATIDIRYAGNSYNCSEIDARIGVENRRIMSLLEESPEGSDEITETEIRIRVLGELRNLADGTEVQQHYQGLMRRNTDALREARRAEPRDEDRIAELQLRGRVLRDLRFGNFRQERERRNRYRGERERRMSVIPSGRTRDSAITARRQRQRDEIRTDNEIQHLSEAAVCDFIRPLVHDTFGSLPTLSAAQSEHVYSEMYLTSILGNSQTRERAEASLQPFQRRDYERILNRSGSSQADLYLAQTYLSGIPSAQAQRLRSQAESTLSPEQRELLGLSNRCIDRNDPTADHPTREFEDNFITTKINELVSDNFISHVIDRSVNPYLDEFLDQVFQPRFMAAEIALPNAATILDPNNPLQQRLEAAFTGEDGEIQPQSIMMPAATGTDGEGNTSNPCFGPTPGPLCNPLGLEESELFAVQIAARILPRFNANMRGELFLLEATCPENPLRSISDEAYENRCEDAHIRGAISTELLNWFIKDYFKDSKGFGNVCLRTDPTNVEAAAEAIRTGGNWSRVGVELVHSTNSSSECNGPGHINCQTNMEIDEPLNPDTFQTSDSGVGVDLTLSGIQLECSYQFPRFYEYTVHGRDTEARFNAAVERGDANTAERLYRECMESVATTTSEDGSYTAETPTCEMNTHTATTTISPSGRATLTKDGAITFETTGVIDENAPIIDELTAIPMVGLGEASSLIGAVLGNQRGREPTSITIDTAATNAIEIDPSNFFYNEETGNFLFCGDVQPVGLLQLSQQLLRDLLPDRRNMSVEPQGSTQ